ncbi:MAG: sugar transferase [Chlorobi bacterium]|nr:sugar transferase [Chlorobiota bacterium]
MKHKKHLFFYIFFDYLAAITAWALFFIYRKKYVETPFFGNPVEVRLDTTFFIGLLCIPLMWLILHFLSGYYRNIIRKSRLKELAQTFVISLTGTIILHFTVILNDITSNYTDYYRSFIVLFSLQFVLTYFPRLIHTTIIHHRMLAGPLAFQTLIIGTGNELTENIQYLQKNKYAGNRVIGIVPVTKSCDENALPVPVLGKISDLSRIITKHQIDEVILAFSPDLSRYIGEIMNKIIYLQVSVKAIPSLYPALLGRVKIQPLLDVPYLQINYELMPVWQVMVKTVFDYVSALTILVVTLPVSLVVSVIIKISSDGPVIYSHERIGRHGKPFTIYKFRTMVKNAEINGPALSSRNDPRITPVGRFLRKTRLDELPNFINVLKGDMSIVGPRPERKFFVDQIVKKDPDYIYLQKVKPGITSWGQVQYGYAENVDQMVERLQYDLNYIKNMSLYIDFKILILTLLTICRGRGM